MCDGGEGEASACAAAELGDGDVVAVGGGQGADAVDVWRDVEEVTTEENSKFDVTWGEGCVGLCRRRMLQWRWVRVGSGMRMCGMKMMCPPGWVLAREPWVSR